MALTRTNIIGRITLPDDTNPVNSVVRFVMTGFDTDDTENATIIQIPIDAAIDALGDIEVDLWSNPLGVRTTFYSTYARIPDGNTNDVISIYLGQISVPSTGGPYDLNDLLPISPPAGATVSEYIAQLAAAVASTEANAVTASDSAAAAVISAAQAALYDGVWLDNEAAVLADVVLTYTVSQPGTVAAGNYVQTKDESFSYIVAASGAVDQDVTTAGGVKLYYAATPGKEFADPVAADNIPLGAVVVITKASGEKDYYTAPARFAWVDLLTHVFTATPDLVRQRYTPARYGQVPAPTGHTIPVDFTVYSAGDGKFVTSLDRKEDYRAQYQPAYTRAYYLDNVNGLDANDGLTLATAKKTFGSVRTAINLNGDGVVYVQHSGKAYDESDGPTHTATVDFSWSLIGLADAHGTYPYLCNGEKAADFTFTQNATYAWVYESTPPSVNMGRIHDITQMKELLTPQGAVKVPMEYTAQTSVAAVAANAGSYWNDTSGAKLYVHLIGAPAPVVSTNIVIPRSNIGIITTSQGGLTFYGENFTLLSEQQNGGVTGSHYYNNCTSVGSNINGFYTAAARDFGTRNCVAVNTGSDGFNYHNFGSVITAVTQANPAVVSSATADFVNGDIITIADATGMTELNGDTYTVANVVAGVSFELAGVDSTGFGAYTGTSGRSRLVTSTYHAINPTVLVAGRVDGAQQCSTGHENVQGWTINPYFTDAYRDTVTDIQTSKHAICGGYLGTTRIPAVAGTDNRMITITDTADTALFGVKWGGYFDPIAIFSVSGSGVIRVMDTDLPYDATRWTGATDAW